MLFKEIPKFNSVKNTLKNISNFLKNPIDKQAVDQSKQQKTKVLFSLLVIDIPSMIVLSVIISGFEKIGWVEFENHQIALLLDRVSIWLVFLLTVIIIPFIEEVIFRLFLRFKRNYLLKLIIYFFPKHKTSIYEYWNKKYKYVFYLSAILFGLVHITNFETNTTIIYLIPILILPQLVIGLFVGYLRVRYNFMLGYLMHALHNAIFISVALLSIEKTSNQKLNLETNDYSLKIEEVSRVKMSYVQNHNEDSINFIGTSLKNIISTLTKKDLDLIDSNNKIKVSKNLTLNFKKISLKNINKDSIMIKHLIDMYSFDIEKKQKNQKVYCLYIKDTVKLFNHISQKNNVTNHTSTSITVKNITFKNVKLNQISKTLSTNYEARFEYDSTINKEFNINLPNHNFSKLKSVLKTEYGIYLREMNKEVEYIYLNFHK